MDSKAVKYNLIKLIKQNWKAIFIIITGSVSWSLTMVKSGLIYGYGIGFWGPNGHDGVWHIALTESLVRGTWEMPIFAGEMIKNYHIGFDLLLASIHKVTSIPIVNLYFQFMPPILALGIGYFLYRLIRLWKGESEALWSLFFVYFGGNFGWLVTLYRTGSLGGESMFWSQQAVSTLINPPFALSLLMIFAGLFYLLSGLKKNDKRNLITASVLFGLLAQVKIYSTVLVLGTLLLAGFWMLVKRRGTALIRVFTGALLISLLLTLPLLDFERGGIELKPFWFLQTMMAFPDRLYWPRFSDALFNYSLAGNWLKYILATIVAFFIFWYGNFGMRFIWALGLVRNVSKKIKVDHIEILFNLMIIGGITLPMLFVQSGTPWNTIQFFYYSLAFSGILAGVFLSEWLNSSKSTILHRIVVLGIILFTIPTTLSTLWYHYLPSRPPAMISKSELETLEFLRDQTEGVVLTLPFNKDAADAAVGNPPRPLYLYESTAYVSAFSEKPIYMEDEVNLNITGYEWMTRRLMALNFFADPNSDSSREILRRNEINYIYLTKFVSTEIEKIDQNVIFENNETIIYRVNNL